MMSRRRGAILRRRDELQRGAVYAITKVGRFRSVFEDMPLVPSTAGTMDLGPWNDQLKVGARLDDSRIDRLPETRPAGTAIELVFGGVAGEIAPGAVVNARFLIVMEMVRKGALGRFVSQHLIGLRREQCFPFFIGFDHLGDRSDFKFLGHEIILPQGSAFEQGRGMRPHSVTKAIPRDS